MSPELTMVVFAVLVVIVAGFSLFRKSNDGHPVTGEGVLEAIKESVPLATELREVAQIAVNSAEQYMLTGKINTNDEAYTHAYGYMRKWFPALSKVTDEDINNAIHDAVLVANYMSSRIKVNRQEIVSNEVRQIVTGGKLQ